MAGCFGGDPREARAFETGNSIRFEIEVDEAGRDWWRENFLDTLDLTPEGVGEALSASWAGERRMTVTELDGRRKRFAIRVDGRFGDGDFWFHARTVDLQGSFVNADRMFVSPDKQGDGIGRAFMKDLVTFCKAIKVREIRLDAEHVGRYAWLRAGFCPDRGSWSILRMELLQRLMAALPDLGQPRFMEIMSMINSKDPGQARKIAALRDPVKSLELLDETGAGRSVPLGRAMFLEIGSGWSGAMDFDEEDTKAVVKSYLGVEL